MSKQYIYKISVVCLLMLASCSSTKYLPKGEKLYTGADVKFESNNLNNSLERSLLTELKGLTRPKPNSSFLGLRPKLFAFYIAGTPKKDKGLRYWLKNKIGEPPVLISNVSLQNNENVLQNRMENKGFLHAAVKGDTISRKRKAKAEYRVIPGRQFLIDSVYFICDSSLMGKAVAMTAQKTLLKHGDPYNLEIIKGERDRIDQTLKEQGFYYFSPDYLLLKVDSTISNYRVNLYLTIKPETPPLARKSYTIGGIYIFSNFSLSKTQSDTTKSGAVLSDGIYLVDKDKTFKSCVFRGSVLLKSGEVYNLRDQNLTLSRLISLGTFKFVKPRFETDKSASVPTLNASYYLTPLPKKSLRGEVLGTTKSNNLTGSELSLSWRNRNTFHGAELLQIRGYGGFEVQLSGTQRGYNTYRLGIENTLSVPRFLVPFYEFNTRNAYMPRTMFTLGYEIMNKHELYALNSFSAKAGYNWKENIRKEHELIPVSIIYVQPANVTQQYSDSITGNPSLAKTIEKQFIIGSTYSYTYSDQLEVVRKNNFYFDGNIDLAGNIPGLIQGADYRTGKTATLFGASYSQYIKADVDFRYYFRIGRKSKIASRIIAGFGYPYGNSSEIPFIKQFFTGGTNSIRAFRARSVGPGTYRQIDLNTANFLPDQSGDIKLELNAEYRLKLFSIVNGALFADAGNTWLYNENPDKPGGKFSKDFLNELAVGVGLGLRFDFAFLVLRTDLAFPLSKPWLSRGERWVISQIDFADSKWRKENLVFNLAIGYPF